MDHSQNRFDFVYNEKPNFKFVKKDAMLLSKVKIRYPLATWNVSIVASRAALMNVKNAMFAIARSALSSTLNSACIVLHSDLMEIPGGTPLAQVLPQLVVLGT